MAYIKPLILRSIDAATFAGTYQAINAAGFEGSPFFIRIINDSNVDITVSFDAGHENAHEFIPSGTIFELPSQANSQPPEYIALWKKLTVVWVNGAAGIGNVYLSGYYV